MNSFDLIRARKLCNLFRFHNDLDVINDRLDFKIISDIYPEELQLSTKIQITLRLHIGFTD